MFFVLIFLRIRRYIDAVAILNLPLMLYDVFAGICEDCFEDGSAHLKASA
jgi:hypothetical protein